MKKITVSELQYSGSLNAWIETTGSKLIKEFGNPTQSEKYGNEIAFILLGTGTGKNIFVRIYIKNDEIKNNNSKKVFNLEILVVSGTKCLNDGLDGFGFWGKNKALETTILNQLEANFNVELLRVGK